MPKKDTKLEKLSEKIHITVEEIRNLGVENLDYMFMEIYVEQAAGLTAGESKTSPEKCNVIKIGTCQLPDFAHCFRRHSVKNGLKRRRM